MLIHQTDCELLKITWAANFFDSFLFLATPEYCTPFTVTKGKGIRIRYQVLVADTGKVKTTVVDLGLNSGCAVQRIRIKIPEGRRAGYSLWRTEGFFWSLPIYKFFI
jgi:hypothetical protein